VKKIKKNTTIKKVAILALAISFIPSNGIVNAAVRDYFVTSANPEGVYMGRLESDGIIANANPNDIAGHWAHEPIVHAMAMGAMYFGASGSFLPNQPLTNEQAIAFAVNTRGLGYRANAAGIELREEMEGLGLETPNTLTNIRHLGYLSIARDEGIISSVDFYGMVGMTPVELAEEEAVTFETPLRGILIQRQQFAMVMARALSENDAMVIENQPAAMLSFNDWESVAPANAPYVEALARLSAMGAGGNFNPTGNITRAEAAQVLRNLDEIFGEVNDIQRRFGTVAYYRDIQELATLQGEVHRNHLIRRYDGAVDVLQHQVVFQPTGGLVNYDTVVFRDGVVGGFSLLQIDDQIEYFVQDGVVRYINVVEREQYLNQVVGRLIRVDTEEGTITLRDNAGNEFMYRMQVGTFGENLDGQYIFLDGRRVFWGDLPFGAFVEIELLNNLVRRVSFVGQPELVSEMRGIVIDNNPDFGYITFIDNNANIVTRFYNQNDMAVTRAPYYTTASGATYLARMFPNHNFDPLNRSIADIVPGDIIFIRFSSEDPTLITDISAAANFTHRFGLVRGVSRNEDNASILLQFDNGATSWFDIGPNTFVTRSGVPVSNRDIEIGDRLRLLVNQAVLAPGHVVESVLEVSLEGVGHHIGQILTGNLAGINNLQNQLMLQNARPLTNTGWGNHSQIQELALGRTGNIYFFHEGNRISAEQAARTLSRSSLATYVAMDQSPSGNTIRQVTFRDGRTELLQSDIVMSTTNAGEFMLSSINGNILTDAGTIIRRNGRQVTSNEIFPGDLVQVSLTGGNRAAVVDIIEAPAIENVNIARARIAEIRPGNNFTVMSMSTLLNGEWVFTPVERVFTINPNTLFLNTGGFVDPASFVDFGDDSRIADTFTIVYDGSVATHVVDAPFGNRQIRGTVVSAPGSPVGVVTVRDAQYLQYTNVPIPQWRNWNNQTNAVAEIYVRPNTIIIRNNEVIQASQLRAGDRLRIFANAASMANEDTDLHGYIILVEG